MKELKIKSVLEKTELLGKSAMLVGVETGGFGVLCKLEDNPKVCFVHDIKLAIDLYIRCAIEVMGGFGLAYYN